MHSRAQHIRKTDRPETAPIAGFLGPSSTSSRNQISVDQIETLTNEWLADGQIRQLSETTIDLRRMLMGRLQWYLDHRRVGTCGVNELRGFFAYLSSGHKEPCGRWDYGDKHHAKRKMRSTTVNSYYAHIGAFFSWLVQEELIDASPILRVPRPRPSHDKIQPFSQDQVEALLRATRGASYPQRDEALILFLLDTGVRASELCGLSMNHVDLLGCHATVLGKGDSKRSVFFGRRSARALRAYLRNEFRTSEHPLFTAERSDSPLTRSGVLQIVCKTGKRAGIQGVRCSPHTFRHTFAVEFILAGGNVYSLQQLLGHASLQITERYVKLAEADISPK